MSCNLLSRSRRRARREGRRGASCRGSHQFPGRSCLRLLRDDCRVVSRHDGRCSVVPQVALDSDWSSGNDHPTCVERRRSDLPEDPSKEKRSFGVVLGEGRSMEVATVRPTTAGTLESDLLAAYPGLIRRLALVLRDEVEAEDVAQSAFARALEGRERFHGGDARAWLFTIGLRLAFNELRRRRRAVLRTADVTPVWALKTDPDLWTALAAIGPQPRAALLLNVLDGYTHDEIAGMLQVPPGTVSSWVSRTKERLRQALQEE